MTSSTTQLFKPSPETVKHAHMDAKAYEDGYRHSLTDPDSFWRDMAKRISWFKEPTIIKNARQYRSNGMRTAF